MSSSAVSILARLTDADLAFIARTARPEDDAPALAARLRGDERLLDALLDDDRLFRRLVASDVTIVRVSPWLLFSVLLRRVRRELRGLSYTVEQLGGSKIAVFDADRAAELLDDRRIQDYLVEMLASFTRTDSFAIEVEEGGRRRRRHFSDFSSDDMIALAALMPEDLRFPILRRIADIALFTTGIFPESADPHGRHPAAAPAAGRRRWARRTLEEYEEQGRLFYRLAARHEVAQRTGLAPAQDALAETFALARKPLNVLAAQYIHTSRFILFSGAH